MLSTPTVLSPTSSAVTSTCNAAGQSHVRRQQYRRSIARGREHERGSQVISTRYPFRVDTGFLVRKRWEWTGFLARRGV